MSEKFSALASFQRQRRVISVLLFRMSQEARHEELLQIRKIIIPLSTKWNFAILPFPLSIWPDLRLTTFAPAESVARNLPFRWFFQFSCATLDKRVENAFDVSTRFPDQMICCVRSDYLIKKFCLKDAFECLLHI